MSPPFVGRTGLALAGWAARQQPLVTLSRAATRLLFACPQQLFSVANVCTFQAAHGVRKLQETDTLDGDYQ